MSRDFYSYGIWTVGRLEALGQGNSARRSRSGFMVSLGGVTCFAAAISSPSFLNDFYGALLPIHYPDRHKGPPMRSAVKTPTAERSRAREPGFERLSDRRPMGAEPVLETKISRGAWQAWM